MYSQRFFFIVSQPDTVDQNAVFYFVFFPLVKEGLNQKIYLKQVDFILHEILILIFYIV